MAQAKRSSKLKRRKAALVLGAAGVSLAMGGRASATAPTTNVPSEDNANRIVLGEEEISDISLATFHVFDKENEPLLRQGLRVAAGCGHGGGCGGCGHGGGCGGCAHAGGCGGCARGGGCAAARIGCAGGCAAAHVGCARGCAVHSAALAAAQFMSAAPAAALLMLAAHAVAGVLAAEAAAAGAALALVYGSEELAWAVP